MKCNEEEPPNMVRFCLSFVIIKCRVGTILTLELSIAACVELRLHRDTVAVRSEELVADRLVWMLGREKRG